MKTKDDSLTVMGCMSVLVIIATFILASLASCNQPKSKYEQAVEKREEVYRVDDSLKHEIDVLNGEAN